MADLINAINSGPANNGTAVISNGQIVLTGYLADCIDCRWRHRPGVDRICGDDCTTGRLPDARCGDVGADIDRHGRRWHAADHHCLGTGLATSRRSRNCKTAIQGLTGVIGSVDANGDISLTETDATPTLGHRGHRHKARISEF